MGGKADQNLTKLTVGLFENEGYVLKKKKKRSPENHIIWSICKEKYIKFFCAI